jgi:uncharacterized protein YdhG (YjbR/CyaY superfamily)
MSGSSPARKRAGSHPKRGDPFRTVGEYLAAQPREKRTALERLRKAIRAAASKAEECIRYGIPAFRLDGRMLVWYHAATRHCSFFPGTALENFRRELEDDDTSKGTVRFSPERRLPASLVRMIVRARMARNAARNSAVGARRQR